MFFTEDYEQNPLFPRMPKRFASREGSGGPSGGVYRWDEEAAPSDLQLGCRRCALEVQGENGHVELYE